MAPLKADSSVRSSKRLWLVVVLSVFCLVLVAAVFLLLGYYLGESKNEEPKYLFSQTAQSSTVDRQSGSATITLNGVSPSTVRFSEYPYEVADTLETSRFIEDWSATFKKKQPNASFSFAGAGGARSGTAVGKIMDASYRDGTVTYKVVALSENDKVNEEWKDHPLTALPEQTGPVAVFIDAGEADTAYDTGNVPPDNPRTQAVDNPGSSIPGAAAPPSRYVWRQWQVNDAATGGADPLPTLLGQGSYAHICNMGWRLVYCGEDEGGVGYMIAYDYTGSFGMYAYDFNARGGTDPLTEPPLANGKWQFNSTDSQLVYLDGDLVLEVREENPWDLKIWSFNRDARGGENPVPTQVGTGPQMQRWYSECYYIGNDLVLYVPTLSPSDRQHSRELSLLKVNRGESPTMDVLMTGYCPIDGYFSTFALLDDGILMQIGDWNDKAHTDDYILYKVNYAASSMPDLFNNVTDRGRWSTINSNQWLVYVGHSIMFNLGAN